MEVLIREVPHYMDNKLHEHIHCSAENSMYYIMQKKQNTPTLINFFCHASNPCNIISSPYSACCRSISWAHFNFSLTSGTLNQYEGLCSLQ